MSSPCTGSHDILQLSIVSDKMKGRYNGCHMTVYGNILPGASSLARWAARAGNLTVKARQRLKVLDWLRIHNNNISLTARHFGLNRETIGIWHQRFKREGLVGLNDKSHRPKKLRQPVIPWETIDKIVSIRKQYPAWSKYKIRAVLQAEAIEVSASTIGRILKRKGLVDKRMSKRRTKSARHPKARFPRGLRISKAGDLIQMDVKHVMLPGGRRHYQFTAIDVLSKQRILERYSSESSRNGALFLEVCLKEFPFAIKAVQTDNGSTFQKWFDLASKRLGIIHFYIYPRSPKQNSYVEISHGADEREFYQQGNVWQDPDIMRAKLKEWQRIWNEFRPHQALNYLTPRAYYEKWQHGQLPTKDIISLQT